MRLVAPGVSADVDLVNGGRLRSLEIAGTEILVTDTGDPLTWGCYPMAPWAGRTGNGRFSFAGREHLLERTLPPHAIHGTVWLRRWEQVDEATIATDLGGGWPFAGSVRQRFRLTESSLRVDMMLDAVEAMPVVLGWHPWFRREIGAGTASIDIDAAFVLERGPDDLPTGRRVAPGSGPWDDCFGGVSRFPSIVWPGLRLTIGSTCAYYVVYTAHPDGVCIEPQTAPPNALNGGADVLAAGERRRVSMEWRWSKPAPGGVLGAP